MANFRQTPNFNDQNNLYPEPSEQVGDTSSTYKPIITSTFNDQETDYHNKSLKENYYRQDINGSNMDENLNFQVANQFDVQVNPKQTIRAFNKDIRIVESRNTFNKIINFLSHKWWLVLIVLTALAVVSLALWQLLKPNDIRPGPFNQVQANIIAPAIAASGSPYVWKVEIKNLEKVDLINVELNLQFDSQFSYIKTNTTPSSSEPKGNKYFFSQIDAVDKVGGTSSVIVEFEGRIIGRIDDQTYMQGTLIYTPKPLEKFSDNRQEVILDKVKTTISQPLVSAVISADNSEVESGTEARLKINFENLSDREMTNLRLKMTYPGSSSFEYISSELLLSNSSSPRLNPSDSNNIWDVSTLPSSGQQELKIVGKMQGVENSQNTFKLEIQIKRSDDSYQNIFSTSKDIKIISRPLVISSYIKNKTEESIFYPGEDLIVQIDYKNQSQSILNNIKISSIINDPAEVLDYNTLKFLNLIVGNESNKTITWGGQSAGFLVSMSPGLEGSIQFSIKVKTADLMINPSFGQGSYTLIPRVEATADNIQPVISQGKIYKAAGNVTFEAEKLTYISHPTDANKRIYTVVWKVNTAQNNLKDFSIITSSLLPSSAWQPNSLEPKNISYNPANGEISLKLDTLESLYGINKSSYLVKFDLEVSKQAGSFDSINLHKVVILTATDSFTGQTYSKKLPEVVASK